MKNTKDRKNRKSIVGTGLLIFVLILVLVAIGLTIATSFVKQDSQKDIGDYIAIFSILITAIAIVLPITSYIINKDELKKVTEEFNAKINEADEKIGYLDVRHVELLESLIKKDNMSNIVTNDPYVLVGIEYINALLLFENGAYEESLLRVENAIKGIFDKHLTDLGKDNDKNTLLVYKVFNLYRKLAGRTRSFDSGLLSNLKKLMREVDQTSNKLLYKTIVFLYVKSRLDKVEKTFDTKDGIDDLDEWIDRLENDDKLIFNTLKARKCYIVAYYFHVKNSREVYRDAVGFAYAANAEQKELKNVLSEKEVEKLLANDCRFTIAKVLEKSSYGLENSVDVNNALSVAKDIIEQLIKGKKDAKYYLELSEILKKSGRVDESSEAALYGILLAPSDPLLAAQCAYVYLREYLLNLDIFNLNKAQEYIKTAHWLYNREKERYKNNINAKFSYIASLNATISMFKCVALNLNISVDTLKAGICKDINSSIADNEHNVPNYKRAFIIYMKLFECYNSEEIKRFCFEETKKLIVEFQSNMAFRFVEGEVFYPFSKSINEISVQDISAVQLMDELHKTLNSPVDNV